ncbi:helix-turn-helix transcriptional regulator [Colwelliaceae bacterium 6471]
MFLAQDKINNIVVEAISHIGEESFVSTLAKQLRDLVSCDSLVMMLYSDHAFPDVIHDEIKELSDRAFKDIYLKGAYLLSPLYIAHRQGNFGFFSFDELIPEGFFQSEYYLSYYSKCGLTDQLILLTKINEQQTLAISLGLLANHYAPEQKKTLADISTIIQAIVCKHGQLQQQVTQPNLQNQLQLTFDLFASSVLTQREQAVVKTLMQGHSSKSAAKLLNISVDTERSYRKSAYSKLNISSQSELFNLFFKCLSCSDQCSGQDPLVFLAASRTH